MINQAVVGRQYRVVSSMYLNNYTNAIVAGDIVTCIKIDNSNNTSCMTSDKSKKHYPEGLWFCDYEIEELEPFILPITIIAYTTTNKDELVCHECVMKNEHIPLLLERAVLSNETVSGTCAVCGCEIKGI